MLEDLKQKVLEANLELQQKDLVLHTWGNASGIDRSKGLVVIKPSGVPYSNLKSSNMVVTDLDGEIVDGDLRPSSDLRTHLLLYKKVKEIGGIVHTHSTFATIWAQAGLSIPPLGTTHADYFYGHIPCTRKMTKAEVREDYETLTGSVILESFSDISPKFMPGVLVNNHGPFSWGKDAEEAVHNAVVLEQLARMAYHTVSLSSQVGAISKHLLDKHFLRKHGKDAYYGQED